jgi:hypothetical protein
MTTVDEKEIVSRARAIQKRIRESLK